VESRETAEDPGGEREDPCDADDERDEMRKAGAQETVEHEVVEAKERRDEQRRHGERRDTQARRVAHRGPGAAAAHRSIIARDRKRKGRISPPLPPH